MALSVFSLMSLPAGGVRQHSWNDDATDVEDRPPTDATPARAGAYLFGWLRLAAAEPPASDVLSSDESTADQAAEDVRRPAAAGASLPAAVTDAGLSERLLTLVNERRVAAGLSPLAVNSRLATAARAYAVQMAQAGWFSHSGPDGSTLLSRVTAAGLAFDAPFGEVIWRGAPAPEAIVQAWIDSPSHSAQILGAYSRAGAGCASLGQQVWCVVDLAG